LVSTIKNIATMPSPKNNSRRKFAGQLSIAAAAIMATPLLTKANSFFKADDSITVGQIMDMFIKTVPNSPFPKTVDTIKAGSCDMVVKGIVTTMFPTIAVIKKAISLDANFILCHEPTFYNHEDDVSWLQNDEVYRYKADLLSQHNITIWRNHDYIHSLRPDGVVTGVVDKLGWKQYQRSSFGFAMEPGISLIDLISHAKKKLNIEKVRYIGDLDQTCKNILLMVGAAGGKAQISAISTYKPDVLICGEISEWETAEYVRDARLEGRQLSLVLLGHIASEEPGSEFMLNWLKERLPGMKVTHVSSGNSLSFA
jgi:putative NIF3 family GTP cyclohydrolase 1 type 2